jgi:hypothetical protein
MGKSFRVPFAITAVSILALFALVAPARAANCRACGLAAQDRCAANCFGLEDKGERVACLITCDNAAATCSCDEEVTLRSEDVVAKSPWLLAMTAACHSTTTCGSAYPSCASWSGYSDCNDPYCASGPHCAEGCEPGLPCLGPAMRQWQERFRVCFNAAGQPCTEYQRTIIVLNCGC